MVLIINFSNILSIYSQSSFSQSALGYIQLLIRGSSHQRILCRAYPFSPASDIQMVLLLRDSVQALSVACSMCSQGAPLQNASTHNTSKAVWLQHWQMTCTYQWVWPGHFFIYFLHHLSIIWSFHSGEDLLQLCGYLVFNLCYWLH